MTRWTKVRLMTTGLCGAGSSLRNDSDEGSLKSSS
jgi:hypothetical protein